MSDWAELIDIVPKEARAAIKVIGAILLIAGSALWLSNKADAHIDRRIRPLKLRVYRDTAMLEHILLDHEAERAALGQKPHDLKEIRKEAAQRIREEEQLDQDDLREEP